MPSILGYQVDPERGIVYGLRGRPIGTVNGSGHLQVDARSRGLGQPYVHRLIWEAVNGVIPADKEINHIDGVKTNNRINNLELVTRSENIRHAYRLGLKAHRGEAHPRNRLTNDGVRAIRAGRTAGKAIKDIAAALGVHRRTVTDVLLGRTWTHVTGA